MTMWRLSLLPTAPSSALRAASAVRGSGGGCGAEAELARLGTRPNIPAGAARRRIYTVDVAPIAQPRHSKFHIDPNWAMGRSKNFISMVIVDRFAPYATVVFYAPSSNSV